MTDVPVAAGLGWPGSDGVPSGGLGWPVPARPATARSDDLDRSSEESP